MSIKYNEFGEVISVNGLTTGHHIGKPMQDAAAERPEDNEVYGTERRTTTRGHNPKGNEQPKHGVDWNQNDPSAPDYVKNRTHYTEVETILERQTIDGFVDKFGIGSAFVDLPPIEIVGGEKYIVFWDGKKYELTAAGECLGFGSNNLDPFMLVSYTDKLRVQTVDINTSHEIGITREVVHPLDPKYLPSGTDLVVVIKNRPGKVTSADDIAIESGSGMNVWNAIKENRIPVVKMKWLFNPNADSNFYHGFLGEAVLPVYWYGGYANARGVVDDVFIMLNINEDGQLCSYGYRNVTIATETKSVQLNG